MCLSLIPAEDIDECADFETNFNSPCDPLASCENQPGNFTCVCPDGYQGDDIFSIVSGITLNNYFRLL